MVFEGEYGPLLTSSQVDLETCEEIGTNVVTYVWYRLLQIVWVIVAAVSTLNISRVYFTYIKSSKLHVNIQVLSAILVEYLLYYGASFDELHISTTHTAYEVTGRINIILLFNICSSAFTMATMIGLLLMNIRRKRFAIGVISHRFQAEENIVTTNFIARIAFVQLIAFCVQSLCGLLLRIYGSYIYDVNNRPIGNSLRLLLQVMPLFTLIMSIVVATTMRSIAEKRRSKLHNLMCTTNDIEYNVKFLQDQWSRIEPKSKNYLK
ncbi:unnamed protein product [Cylicocyclus nassatus]|uniref:Uncharacterized protein n=1 Tax=Cylicocyclus nassatus TaxID=53992 RepID=A0AA36H587_CYLNA|nr:unnamed protein product [Cylicocyclus nassatus]